ncbi:F0F1 ATP synthase subunit delta [Candidatus Saccharibacteria bacterium]|nr:F0F1 ATP synthase subunit delta [Candidatus Saccharibacteria bacterium]
MISRHHLAEVIGERTLNISDTKVLAREIAAYLLDTGQTADVEVLLRDVMEYRAQKGIIEAVATSAHEIDNRILSDIDTILRTEFPDATDIIVISKIDTSVVGGIKVSLANEQLDMTVREKLDTFKRLTANIKD